MQYDIVLFRNWKGIIPMGMRGPAPVPCRCGHITIDHRQKKTRVGAKWVMGPRGACEDWQCNCEKFELLVMIP